MSDPYARLAELDAEARSRRAEVLALLRLSRERTRPENLAAEARNRALDFGLDKLGQAKAALLANPLKAAGAALALGALLGYRPLGRWAAGAARKAKRRLFPQAEAGETDGEETATTPSRQAAEGRAIKEGDDDGRA